MCSETHNIFCFNIISPYSKNRPFYFGRSTVLFWSLDRFILVARPFYFGRSTVLFWSLDRFVLVARPFCFGRSTVLFWSLDHFILVARPFYFGCSTILFWSLDHFSFFYSLPPITVNKYSILITCVLVINMFKINHTAKNCHRYVCPDRLTGNNCIKRTADVSKYEPLKKKHCRECFNTNIIRVSEIKKAVDTLQSSTCDQCGVLWADIKEDRNVHRDKDIQKALERVRVDMDAQIKVNKHYQKSLQQTAFGLYYEDKLKSETTLAVSNFRRIPNKEKEKYMTTTKSLARDDMNFLAGTVYENNVVDDRPTVNLFRLPFFLNHHNASALTYDINEITDTYGKFDYIANALKTGTTTHITYQVDMLITTRHWGVDQIIYQYVCYICTRPLDIDYQGENGPALVGAKVCTCSVHKDEAYKDQEQPPQYSPPRSDVAVITVKLDTTPPQTAMHYSGDMKFLYQCNAFFEGYAIHSLCCKMRHQNTSLNN